MKLEERDRKSSVLKVVPCLTVSDNKNTSKIAVCALEHGREVICGDCHIALDKADLFRVTEFTLTLEDFRPVSCHFYRCQAMMTSFAGSRPAASLHVLPADSRASQGERTQSTTTEATATHWTVQAQ